MTIAQGKPRRIISAPDNCIRPFYLPDDRIVYARKTAGRFVIEIADPAGGKPLALTHIPSNALLFLLEAGLATLRTPSNRQASRFSKHTENDPLVIVKEPA
jgi:hypothetical protein